MDTSEHGTVSAEAVQRRGAVPVTRSHTIGTASAGSRRLALRFHLSMLGIVAIDGSFAVIYGVPFHRSWPTGVAMTVLMLIGAQGIFRPVMRYLRNPQGVRVPVRAVATRGTTCTAYAAAVVSALAVAKLLILPSLLGFDIDALLTPNEQIWLPIIHTLYYTALAYFVMTDYEGSLRASIAEWHGSSFRQPTGVWLFG